MKGRNSTVVSIRIPDSVYATIKGRANGQSVPEYIKDLVIRSVNAKQQTITELRKLMAEPSQPVVHSVDTTVPLYNPAIHRAGDRVLIRHPHTRKLVETVIPHLDADGQPIPD